MTMARMRHRLVQALWSPFVAVCAAAGMVLGQDFPLEKSKPPRVQEVVGAGRWLHEGGGLGRNAASANAPLWQRPTLAWRQPLEGTLLGEPRVWDEHIVLAIKVSDKRRRIEVRRLLDGSVVGKREINCVTDPALALWAGEIVWRTAPGCLELLRYDDFDVKFVKRMKSVDSVAPPLRDGNNVLTIVDGRLVCLRATDFRELWQGSWWCVGTLSMLDGQVYALQKKKQQYTVIAHDHLTGKVTARSPTFKLLHDPGEALRMQLAGKTLVLRVGDEDALAEFRAPNVKLNALQFELPLAGNRAGTPGSMTGLHALDRSVHIAAMDIGEGPELALFPNGKAEGLRLDSCDLHRDLAKLPATLVDGVLYFGACAVETRQFHMLWRMATVDGLPLPASRAIPAGRSLLLFDEHELVALRADEPRDAIAAELRQSMRVAERDQLEPLVRDAIKANDWALAHELLARCRELRSDEVWARTREKQIAAGERNKRRRLSASKSQAVKLATATVPSRTLQAVQQQVAGWAVERDAWRYRRGLRFVLEHDAQHPSAIAAVRALLPERLRATEPFHAIDWLDYLGATSHTQVSVLDATSAEIETALGEADAFAAADKQRLLQWRKRWRSDLNAVQSDRLLLFSPLTQPGSLTKALVTGELVCDVLEQMFAHMPKVRREVQPMLVFIYPDRDDYLAESNKIGAGIAEMAAGYYSWQEKPPKSRLYVPNDAAGFAGVLPTLAHELTHQWLMDRCTAFKPNLTAARVGPKAFWIVEGFASLVEQFSFDLERRKFALGQGGDRKRADMVASLTAAQQLPWLRLTKLTRRGFARMTRSKQQLDVGSRTRLGRRYRVRPVDLFYAQSAMLARYLYEAEHGRYRQQLLDFVAHYYTGNLEQLDFEKAFGIAPETLGPKVLAFSRQLVE